MAANFCNLILEAFSVEILIIFYCQCAKFRNAEYEKVYLDLFQCFFKIKLKTHSQFSKKFVDKFCSPSFCAILSSHKNVSNMLCLIIKILREKTPIYHSLSSSPAALFYLDYHPTLHKVRGV